jgi:hypothetical protein
MVYPGPHQNQAGAGASAYACSVDAPSSSMAGCAFVLMGLLVDAPSTRWACSWMRLRPDGLRLLMRSLRLRYAWSRASMPPCTPS